MLMILKTIRLKNYKMNRNKIKKIIDTLEDKK